jgi:hypothetical protein
MLLKVHKGHSKFNNQKTIQLKKMNKILQNTEPDTKEDIQMASWVG